MRKLFRSTFRSTFKRRERIYIFPNRFGFLGFGLFLVALAAGATYQNNLVFMMAFFIISLSLVAILQTARNIRDLDILSFNVDSNFAGQSTTAHVTIASSSSDPKINLELVAEFVGVNKTRSKFSVTVSVTALTETATLKTTVALPTSRGEYKLRRLAVKSAAPYGLFGAWIYLPCQSTCVVYPAPLGHRQLPMTTNALGEDFSGHKNYAIGDPMNRIDWRIYSRHRELFVKEFLDGANPRLEFTFDDHSESRREQELSQLSLWLSLAREKNYDFKLNMPNFHSTFASDLNHYRRCMRELSVWAA